MNTRAALYGGLMAAAVFLSGCGGTAASGPGAAAIVINSNDLMKFAPNTINVKAGQKVTLTLKNTGQIAHDFITQGANQNVNLINVGAGKEQSAVFMATKPGTYQIVCNQPGHKEAGMVGTIVVS